MSSEIPRGVSELHRSPMQRIAAALFLLLVGCATPPERHEIAEQAVRVIRITRPDDPVELRSQEFLPVRSPADVISYIEVRFRVLSDGPYEGREITVPIVQGTDSALWKAETFTLRLPTYLLEGKEREEWTDRSGVRRSTSKMPIDFEAELERANQALQTTSVTRIGFGKVPVSDRQRRGV